MGITRRAVLASAAAVAASAALGGLARAEPFHGFDPDKVGPANPDKAALAAMVKDAMAKTPPRNGKAYVFGYTMWGGSSPFSQLNRQGLQEIAEAAGIELLTADNEWDPQKNVANAQSFATRNVDFVINSLLDVQFGGAVKKPLDDAGIPIISLDIPIIGAAWVGVDNARAGFRAGTYVAEAAVQRWGKDKAGEATLVIAAFPLVGPNGRLRNLSQEAGVKSVMPDLPASQIVWLDMQGTADSGFTAMNNLMGRLDPDKPVLVASFSDEQLAGALRALAAAGRSESTLAVGMGGERLDLLGQDPAFVGTMSFFPKGYANAAVPTALAMLAGRPVPKSVFAFSDLVKPDTACKVDPAVACRARPDWQPADAAIDEAAYRAYVAALHQRDEFRNFQVLLPPIPG
ncbi:sugar ABC transporter substrate-binding protein [Labrys wisconsinensis]|uniref:Ribose transport system substrate-binding protein n=1 Tax=Labrys wisconsinensis TaxID=425677 RepID=A0ABU0JJM0_9HYPH|nr:substrate-binding domain-containing protein [Labrys wisconsinensis]MDQ0474477.1 ribose transport system substrate-binding protein [Labrys wisconsinensis]